MLMSRRRRGVLHRAGQLSSVPRHGGRPLGDHRPRALASAASHRSREARLRGLPRARVRARESPVRTRSDRLVHARIGVERRDHERYVPRMSRGWHAHLLERVGARAAGNRLQRLPQSDDRAIAAEAAREAGRLTDLLQLPPRAARAVSEALPHAAARRQNHLQRLSRAARFVYGPASARR